MPEFHDSERFVAVVDPEADRPQDDVEVVHDEYLEGAREAFQKRCSPANGHGSPGDGDLHQVEAFGGHCFRTCTK